MPLFYNRFAGESLHRLGGLSDGVFAIVMTLLVLELHAPAAEAIRSEADLVAALGHLGPTVTAYLMSFLTLGIFWIGQQTQHGLLAKADRAFAWINIAFLMAVSLVPFTTALLAEFIEYRVALAIYWANILAMGLMIYAAWYRAKHFGLWKEEVTPEMDAAIVRRVVIGQSLYAFGLALCLISNWWSIAFIVAVQLQYAIAPRIKPFIWL